MLSCAPNPVQYRDRGLVRLIEHQCAGASITVDGSCDRGQVLPSVDRREEHDRGHEDSNDVRQKEPRHEGARAAALQVMSCEIEGAEANESPCGKQRCAPVAAWLGDRYQCCGPEQENSDCRDQINRCSNHCPVET